MITSNIDIFSEASIRQPYEDYRALRDLGAIIWLERQQLHCISRYADVVRSLRDHVTFSSAAGVGMVEEHNARSIGTLIASDPPEHNALRRVMMAPLTSSAVKNLRPRIQDAADKLVDYLLAKGEFDAISDFAQILPVSIVSGLVGLPERGRENMLRWAADIFDLFGPANERGIAALPGVIEMREYVEAVAHRGGVVPGGWADKLIDLAEQDQFSHDRLPSLFRDFMAPSLDTTINATASLLWLLGTHPDQWRALVDDPSLIGNAIDEAVRLESPIRGFTRWVTADTEVAGEQLSAGSRVLLLFGSANRDERKWTDAEKFDIRRRNRDHVGFGFGVHSCAGMHLAKLEIESLVRAMIERVERIVVGAPVWGINNLLRGIAKMPMTFVSRC